MSEEAGVQNRVMPPSLEHPVRVQEAEDLEYRVEDSSEELLEA
jgi:hypothetical protein